MEPIAGRHCVSTTATVRSVHKNASRVTTAFDGLLLPGLPITSVTYSVELMDASAQIPRHALVATTAAAGSAAAAAAAAVPLSATVALDPASDVGVTVTASQEQPDIDRKMNGNDNDDDDDDDAAIRVRNAVLLLNFYTVALQVSMSYQDRLGTNRKKTQPKNGVSHSRRQAAGGGVMRQREGGGWKAVHSSASCYAPTPCRSGAVALVRRRGCGCARRGGPASSAVVAVAEEGGYQSCNLQPGQAPKEVASLNTLSAFRSISNT